MYHVDLSSWRGFRIFDFLGPSPWPSPPYDPTDRSPITFHTSAWQNPSDPLPLMTWYTTTALDGGLRARAPPPKKYTLAQPNGPSSAERYNKGPRFPNRYWRGGTTNPFMAPLHFLVPRKKKPKKESIVSRTFFPFFKYV